MYLFNHFFLGHLT